MNVLYLCIFQYSLDYIPAVPPTNYGNPASPLSPPTVGIPTNTNSLILSPNKTPTMTMVPTPKQYPAVAAGPPPPVTPITPTYHNKMALPSPHPPPTRHTHTIPYHHYSSPAPLQGAVVLAASPTPATAIVNTPPGRLVKTPLTEQPLLAIDTSHTVEHSALKANTKKTTSSTTAASQPAVTAKPVVVATTEAATSSTATTNMNGTTAIVTNHCVELYTS